MSKPRKSILMHDSHLIPRLYSLYQLYHWYNLYNKKIQFSILLCCCYLPCLFIFFQLESFPSLSLIFMTITFLKITSQLSCRSFLNPCLMFPHDYIQVMHFCQKYHRNDVSLLRISQQEVCDIGLSYFETS